MYRFTEKRDGKICAGKDRLEGGQTKSVESLNNSMQSVLDAIGFGVILLRASGEVAVINMTAANLVNTREWLRVTDKRLRGSGKENLQLTQRIKVAVERRDSKSTILLQNSDSGRVDSLLLTISPLGTGDCALGVLIDPNENSCVDITPLKQLYALTDAEADITSHLANGLDYAEIATERNVSVTTIRSHSKSIFKKLSVNSRAEVVRKVHATLTPLNLV